MKLTYREILLATFAITLSTSVFIAKQELTSAVLVDKAKHSLNLTTNGLHNISLGEAFAIDRSKAAQINFLQCSFSRPEFRFSLFCHQQKIAGKMTNNSHIALINDQEAYFKDNLIKSVHYDIKERMFRTEQLQLATQISKLSYNRINNMGEYNEKHEEYYRTAIDLKIFNEKYKDMIDSVSLKQIENKLLDRESPSSRQDYESENKSILSDLNNGPFTFFMVIALLSGFSKMSIELYLDLVKSLQRIKEFIESLKTNR